MVSDAILCPLHNLNTLWYIGIILYSYEEQVMTMRRVQQWQLWLSHFPRYFPLIVSNAISCPLHTLNSLWYIMIQYSYVELVMAMCHVQE